MRKFIINIVETIKTIFSPNCWVRNYCTSEEWDEKLNKMMDNGEEIEFRNSLYSVVFKSSNVVVWTSNYPYAYGHPRLGDNVLPTRATVRRLRRYVNRQRFGVDNSRLLVFLGYEQNEIVRVFKTRAKAEEWCLQQVDLKNPVGRSYQKMEVV